MKTKSMVIIALLAVSSILHAEELESELFDNVSQSTSVTNLGEEWSCTAGDIPGIVTNSNSFSPDYSVELPSPPGAPNATNSSMLLTGDQAYVWSSENNPVMRISARVFCSTTNQTMSMRSGTASGERVIVRFDGTDGRIKLNGTDTGISFVAGKWADLSVYYNIPDNTASLDYDGTNNGSWIALGGSPTNFFNHVGFHRETSGTGTIFVDNLIIETFPASTVAWWRFDEGADDHLADHTGLFPLFDTSISGSRGWTNPVANTVSDGQDDFNNLYAFAGPYTSKTFLKSSVVMTNWTYEGVVRFDPGANNTELLDLGVGLGFNSPNSWIAISWQGSHNNIAFNLRDGSQSSTDSFSSNNTNAFLLADGMPHHFAVVKTNALLITYVDYQAVATNQLGAYASGVYEFNTNSQIRIGVALNNGNGSSDKHVYDELRLSKGALAPGAFLRGSNSLSSTTYYVDALRPDDSGDGMSWGTAKKTIQAAVDLTVDGDTVMVANGIYDTGTRVTPGYSLLNRVVITNAIEVRSMNGPAVTIIKGAAATGGGTGTNAVRCVYMHAGVLSGFTITNGYTRTSGNNDYDRSGGGVNMYDGGGMVTNCAISGNTASYYGGGSYAGTLNNCALSGNYAYYGGGSYEGTLNNCTISKNSAHTSGGGSYYGTLNNCTLSGNAVPYSGGGSYYGTLKNCTLSGNSAQEGGGSNSGTLKNCTLSGNHASYRGGGSAHDTLNNCTLSENSADYGGGSYYGMLKNCTLSKNSASIKGGGNVAGTLKNCIIYSNTAPSDTNWYNGTISYSCTTPAPSGTGNITDGPQFVNAAGSDFHLQTNSPCINVGNNADAAMPYDLDGNDRIYYGTVDMGAYEATPTNGRPVISSLSASPDPVDHGDNMTLTATGVADSDGTVARVEFYYDANSNAVYEADIDRPLATNSTITGGVASVAVDTSEAPTGTVYLLAIAYDNTGKASLTASTSSTVIQKWNLSYQVSPSGSGNITESPAAGQYINGTEINPSATATGNYSFDHWEVNGTTQNMPVTLNTNTTVTAIFIRPETYYVDAARSDDSGNGMSWGAAKKTIQAAVDMTRAGDTVMVTNGTYSIGGGVTPGESCANRVVITNDITVISVNGPEGTIIQGAAATGGGNGADAVRCVYMSAGVLSGFTITNGHTRISGHVQYNQTGGGVNMYYGGMVTNCTISGNSANSDGGGSCYGTLNNCTISGNSAGYSGGGSAYGTLNNCMLSGNSSASYGGGSSYGTLNNCTISGNSANYGGGSFYGTLNNCIIYFNTAGTSGNNWLDSTISYSCTTPAPSGSGNITNTPQFINATNGNYHLMGSSPCINSGNNANAPMPYDLDGNDRIAGGTVDMGCYELGTTTINDFDGDLTSDIGIFRPSSQYWVVKNSSDGSVLKLKFGIRGDIPAPADFGGDLHTDIAVFRPSTGWWFGLPGNGGIIRHKWGVKNDVAVPADYDGDGGADLAIFRPSTQQWVIKRSSDDSVLKRKFGIRGDIPVPADYDGDGSTDIAVFRPSTGWWFGIMSSGATPLRKKWGIRNDVAVSADYDGDGIADLAIFRPSTQHWVIKRSSDGSIIKRKFGIRGDQPVPADYDGDGLADICIFRPSTGHWVILKSSDGTILKTKWGIPGDQPVSVQYWINKQMR